MKIKDKIKEISIVDIFLIILIVGLCLLFAYINLFRYEQSLNSDIAAEALLAREIWETKQWVPDTWYASTETRIISTATWSALFYGLTKSLSKAMGLGCISGMFFLLLCGGYLAKELQLSRTQKLLFLALCLLLPNDIREIQMIYTQAAYYVCHLGMLLWTLGWYIRMLKAREKTWGMGFIIYSIHFLLGGQGVRAVLMISGPLFAMEIIRRVYLFYKNGRIAKRDNWITISVLFTVIAGYLGGKLSFSVGQPLSRNIRNAPSKFIEQIIPHFLDTFAWGYLNTIEKISMFVCLAGVVYLVIFIVKKGMQKEEIENKEWAFLACILSVFLTMMALTFTTIDSANRYYILIFFAMALALVIFWGKNKIYQSVVLVIVVITLVGNCYRVYLPVIENKGYEQNETIQVAKYLEQQGYSQGYTTFEHANYMTVAVDGNVQVAVVESMKTMKIAKWLTSVKWYVPNVPYESKTAYIVTELNLEDFQEFYGQHKDEIEFDTKIGMYHIYGSDYNYSILTD